MRKIQSESFFKIFYSNRIKKTVPISELKSSEFGPATPVVESAISVLNNC